jgi:hypothetical protein
MGRAGHGILVLSGPSRTPDFSHTYGGAPSPASRRLAPRRHGCPENDFDSEAGSPSLPAIMLLAEDLLHQGYELGAEDAGDRTTRPPARDARRLEYKCQL